MATITETQKDELKEKAEKIDRDMETKADEIDRRLNGK
ncbi:hypothetical protein LCGC14_2479910 [marine sediment metagenome]|uniref:Uncharacterized protein n=1 Tax=marine sediment metagenome TaxID=412755 RepID=A0A0F9B8N4_9ZZZZ